MASDDLRRARYYPQEGRPVTYIKIGTEPTVTIELPGLTALKIDAVNRTIAIDGISWPAGEPGPEWQVQDLRDGIYGDFHRLTPSSECGDAVCAQTGQHVGPYESGQEG